MRELSRTLMSKNPSVFLDRGNEGRGRPERERRTPGNMENRLHRDNGEGVAQCHSLTHWCPTRSGFALPDVPEKTATLDASGRAAAETAALRNSSAAQREA